MMNIHHPFFHQPLEGATLCSVVPIRGEYGYLLQCEKKKKTCVSLKNIHDVTSLLKIVFNKCLTVLGL